jgi:ribonuclease E
MAPAARAQSFFSIFEPPSLRIEQQLEAAGYDLHGPVVQRGDVYVADVVAQGGERERLVIDARTSRIVRRWRVDRFGNMRDREDPDSWDTQPRPPFAVPQRPHDEFARTDPAAKPNVIFGEDGMNGPATSTFEVDKPKPKPHVAKKKPAPVAPLAKASPSAPPPTEVVVPTPPPNPAAVVTTPPNAPGAESQKPVSPTAKVQVETPNGVEAKPAVEAKPVEEAKPSVELRAVTQTKPPTEASPATETKPTEAKPVAETKPVAEVKAAAPATGARPDKKPKAVNDVPVNPLD